MDEKTVDVLQQVVKVYANWTLENTEGAIKNG
jgi:hypothetical protein